MTLTRITNAKTIRSAVRTISTAFKRESVRHETKVGFPGGSKPVSVWWNEEAGIWICPPSEWIWVTNRYWFGYGTVPPGDRTTLPIAVEINFPLEGINRRVKGLLALDGRGQVVICHNGQLGGRLGTGTQAEFARFWGRDQVSVHDDDGESPKVFLVADLGSDRMITQIAEFVRACAAFKAGDAGSNETDTPDFFTGSDEEFEGTKEVNARSGYTASCDHGIVRNRLASLLKQAGQLTHRDTARDLIVGNPKKPETEFEIKTACDPQHVYAAVGQLLVHSVSTPAKSRVAVLPKPVPTSMRNALKSLDIHLVQYRWTKTKIHFDGLTDLYPNAATSAPINQTH